MADRAVAEKRDPERGWRVQLPDVVVRTRGMGNVSADTIRRTSSVAPGASASLRGEDPGRAAGS